LPSHQARSLTRATDYFTKVLEDDLKAIVKPQYVDQLPRAIKGPVKTVKPLIEAKSELGNMKHIMDVLGKCKPTPEWHEPL
jgi:ATP-binding cassette subfamily E protein 1